MWEMSINPLDEKEIRYLVSQIKELPPLPQALKRLIEIIHSQIDYPGELESIISYDPSLAVKIIKIANSTYYGYRKKVKTLTKAIAVIGADQVKSICICTLLMGLLSNRFTISAQHRQVLWKHAFASSKIAAEMTRKRPWMNADEAAVLGLVHDLGWMVMAAHFSKQFKAIFETAANRHIPPWYVEEQYGLDHSRLGKYLASRWALPEEFKAVIEFHHCPERSRYFKTEVKLMHLVNVLSHSREYPELAGEESTLIQCRDLYISEDEWQEYQESVEKIWPEVDQLWNLLGEQRGQPRYIEAIN
jgi:HD-like signal output (HDOD) protein